MLDDFDLDIPEEGEAEAEAGSNRTFIMVAGGLGGLLLIAMICMAIYALVILPRQQAGDEQQAATQTAEAQQAALDQSLTETAIALAYTPTVTDTPQATDTPTATLEPSPTSGTLTTEEAAPPTLTVEGGPTTDPRTATVQALLTAAAAAQTQAAGSLNTVTPTSTLIGAALPDTGFFDDAGAPALISIAAILVLVIIMARRLRQANA